MNVRQKFPHKIREIENCWIPLSDGTRLAARIWLPEDAEEKPVPALQPLKGETRLAACFFPERVETVFAR